MQMADRADYQRFRDAQDGLVWNLRAVRTVVGLTVLSLVILPLQSMMLKILPSRGTALPILWHRIASRLIGLDVVVMGEPVQTGGVLFISNHVSWLDIVVLGKTLKASFVARKEVADWGIFGTFARLQRTFFIDRARRTASKGQSTAMKDRLMQGDNLILFPEGTSTSGNSVQPFKSALFSVVEQVRGDAEQDPVIQPLTISYTAFNGIPVVRSQRPLVAWYGDMELTRHVWSLLGLGRVKAVVIFHPPVTVGSLSRKELAQICHDMVSDGLVAARGGR